jgi:hypothetical protein
MLFEAERRIALKEAQGGHLDFGRLLDTPKGALQASKWIIQSGRILQFQLAGSLLYKAIQEQAGIGVKVFKPALENARFSLTSVI